MPLSRKDINNALDALYLFSDFAKRRQVKYNQKNYQTHGLKNLLKAFNNPHLNLKIFHIAGTKGKGSTAFYLAKSIEHRGFKVGLYTSPQVIDERDRFCINNKKISWAELIGYLNPLLTHIKIQKIRVTVFDIFTAIAFLYFKKNEVDYAIIETGLGGRLDSTNVVNPLGVILTKIGLDHTDKLGKTLSAIAREKAGIIKEGTPTFTSKQSKSVMAVIVEIAKKKSAALYQVTSSNQDLELPEFQKENIAIAFACFNYFFSPLTLREKEKVSHKQLMGRFDLRDNYLFDGAHNPVAFKALVKAVKGFKAINSKKIKLIFYCLPDKDFDKIIKYIPVDWEITFFPLPLSFLNIEDHPLLKKKKKYPQIKFPASPNQFKAKSENETLYIVAGSFYLIQYFWKHINKV